MPQVTIIIPTYNRWQFLAGAVKSVLEQSLKDVEIIVVDDCSNDNTAAVIESFQGTAVRYIRHDRRRGAAAARNTGILQASGEYIAFLDDDDEWYPEKLTRQVQQLVGSATEVGGVYTGCFVLDRSNGQMLGQIVPLESGDVQQALLAGNCVGGASSMLMRHECFERVGLFDERLPSFQEYDLWLRAARHYQFECIRAPLVKHYVDPDRERKNSDVLMFSLELMLAKYGRSQAFRRKCSAYYLGLGIQYAELKQFLAARKAFLRAARLNPLVVEPYAYLALTLLGGDGFNKARRVQASLLPRFRTRQIHGFAESA